jgi:hypothetical protein
MVDERLDDQGHHQPAEIPGQPDDGARRPRQRTGKPLGRGHHDR